jgi:hypothetical protein
VMLLFARVAKDLDLLVLVGLSLQGYLLHPGEIRLLRLNRQGFDVSCLETGAVDRTTVLREARGSWVAGRSGEEVALARAVDDVRAASLYWVSIRVVMKWNIAAADIPLSGTA